MPLLAPAFSWRIRWKLIWRGDDASGGDKLVVIQAQGEMAMETIRRFRALALVCRQQAVLHPEDSWSWLGKAERWEHLAETTIAAHFRECNQSDSLGSELDAA